MRYTTARCGVEIDWRLKGSALRGDVETRCLGVRTSVEVESDASTEAVAALVRLAKQGCFMEQLVQAAVPLTSTLTVNGDVVALDAPP